MSVSYQAIIEKMIKELQSIDAKTSTRSNESKNVFRSINGNINYRVRLPCQL